MSRDERFQAGQRRGRAPVLPCFHAEIEHRLTRRTPGRETGRGPRRAIPRLDGVPEKSGFRRRTVLVGLQKLGRSWVSSRNPPPSPVCRAASAILDVHRRPGSPSRNLRPGLHRIGYNPAPPMSDPISVTSLRELQQQAGQGGRPLRLARRQTIERQDRLPEGAHDRGVSRPWRAAPTSRGGLGDVERVPRQSTVRVTRQGSRRTSGRPRVEVRYRLRHPGAHRGLPDHPQGARHGS